MLIWNLRYMAVSKQASKQTYAHVCNAVPLVWGSLIYFGINERELWWNIPCEWTQVRRSEIISRTPTRYNICIKRKKNSLFIHTYNVTFIVTQDYPVLIWLMQTEGHWKVMPLLLNISTMKSTNSLLYIQWCDGTSKWLCKGGIQTGGAQNATICEVHSCSAV